MDTKQKIGKIEAICLIVIFILILGLLLCKFFNEFNSKDLVDISRLFRW